jgi:hypothetical protein
MTITAPTRSLPLVAGGDLVKRSYDPFGAAKNGISQSNINAPTVVLLSDIDLVGDHGDTVTAYFQSDQSGYWRKFCAPTGSILQPNADFTSASLSWTIPSQTIVPSQSWYFGAICYNQGGFSYAICSIHAGVTSVVYVGSGKTYNDLVEAFAGLKSLNVTSGHTIVIDDNEYTSDTMRMYQQNYSSDQPNLPPSGDYTLVTSTPDNRYSYNKMTTIMARTPFGYKFNGGGTAPYGIYLHGNTDLDTYEKNTLGWSNSGSILASGTERRAIKLLGLSVKDTLYSGIYCYHVDGIHTQYTMTTDAGLNNPSSDVNVMSVTMNNSHNILSEFHYSRGEGRYKWSTYQSRETQARGIFMITDARHGTQPMGGVILYRARRQNAFNLFHVDSQTSDWWPSNTSEVVGSFGMPSTGQNNYPQDVSFDRAIQYKVDMGTASCDAYDQPNTLNSITYNNIHSWYCKPDIKSSGAVMRDGPVICNNWTIVGMDNSNQSYGIYNYRSQQTFNGLLSYNYGYDENNVATGSGSFIYTFASTLPTYINDSLIYSLGANSESVYGGSNGLVKNNVRTDIDPSTNGLKHPGMIVKDSQLDQLNIGAKELYTLKGRQGTFYNGTDSTTDYDDNVLALSMYELVQPEYKTYSVTSITRSTGLPEVLDGNRGMFTDNNNPMDYLTSKGGTDIPWVIDFELSNIGTTLNISWRPFAPIYRTNLTGYDVYVNGELFQSVGADVHRVTFNNMLSNVIYSIYIVANDSVYGSSAPSPIKTIVLG